ncbi:MAG: hypothetical protein AAGH40_08470 [Verrucomicrobiota bacterium]
MAEDGTEVSYLLIDGDFSKGLLQYCGIWAGVFPFKSFSKRWFESIWDDFHKEESTARNLEIVKPLLINMNKEARRAVADPSVFDVCAYTHEHWLNPHLSVGSIIEELSLKRFLIIHSFKKQPE